MDQISEHEVRVYLFLKDNPWWLSIHEIHRGLKDVARTTIGLHLRNFLAKGMVEKFDVYPGGRYKLLPDNGDIDYRTRLEAVTQVFQNVNAQAGEKG